MFETCSRETYIKHEFRFLNSSKITGSIEVSPQDIISFPQAPFWFHFHLHQHTHICYFHHFPLNRWTDRCENIFKNRKNIVMFRANREASTQVRIQVMIGSIEVNAQCKRRHVPEVVWAPLLSPSISACLSIWDLHFLRSRSRVSRSKWNRQ